MMPDDMKTFLYQTFDAKTADSIIKNYSAMLNEMHSEQEELLSPSQFKLAKTRILIRIALYRSIKNHTKGEDALAHTKKYFYAKVKAASKLVKFAGKSELGCTLFRKAFSYGLRADTWISAIKKNDKESLVFDITKCLYKDLCDFYKCPELCMMFCDGDWLAFGDMEKLKFERKYTLGYGDELCDFKFTKQSR
ncbi:MAG TPA: L-2-amino-thiazoline-4-carboxylic acid hydrolase [Spirochaetota bacterium]|nr:L-2-amino-thiazoline-4-carboxylic acid hydrolase [Spirochaetota bacterium]HOS32599.1 L-2-amino-thiazoline-4-carboxylic acid hydrolase [Spirochaetota bacterium]HOS55932.1 L-2-amino-thiazoline-4-carboxylic acid hydrolase [Spirochaetota bacterium]HQF77958.1 L-2-amino-thiazoline-4-carboxylic acid hydrolase [Spirochaetota bacterium]HQH30988.1 L-2-amino-thiazoline-4-carboxylic acid hydrolase [Spirochaetota bacterium]